MDRMLRGARHARPSDKWVSGRRSTCRHPSPNLAPTFWDANDANEREPNLSSDASPLNEPGRTSLRHRRFYEADRVKSLVHCVLV